jgi:hypothetical protein
MYRIRLMSCKQGGYANANERSFVLWKLPGFDGGSGSTVERHLPLPSQHYVSPPYRALVPLFCFRVPVPSLFLY